jgi:hypothetical protein
MQGMVKKGSKKGGKKVVKRVRDRSDRFGKKRVPTNEAWDSDTEVLPPPSFLLIAPNDAPPSLISPSPHTPPSPPFLTTSTRSHPPFPKPKKESSKVWNENRYDGFLVPNSDWQPAVVDSASLTAETFFERFVKTRTPVVIDGYSGLGAWKGASWAKDQCARLREVAEQEKVKVEVRDSAKESFGKGREQVMAFGQFLTSLADGNENRYGFPQNTNNAPILLSPVSLSRHTFDDHAKKIIQTMKADTHNPVIPFADI